MERLSGRVVVSWVTPFRVPCVRRVRGVRIEVGRLAWEGSYSPNYTPSLRLSSVTGPFGPGDRVRVNVSLLCGPWPIPGWPVHLVLLNPYGLRVGAWNLTTDEGGVAVLEFRVRSSWGQGRYTLMALANVDGRELTAKTPLMVRAGPSSTAAEVLRMRNLGEGFMAELIEKLRHCTPLITRG